MHDLTFKLNKVYDLCEKGNELPRWRFCETIVGFDAFAKYSGILADVWNSGFWFSTAYTASYIVIIALYVQYCT